MNARVKLAVFMPMFATSTTEGPSSPEQLIEQMKAAGMLAGAWVVEELVHRLEVLEAEAFDRSETDCAAVKGEAHGLYVELGSLAKDISGMSADLSTARFRAVGELDDAIEHACEVADSLAEEVGILEQNAFSIYNSIDA